MDFQELFLSTNGRVSRKTWWMGFIILLVVSIVLSLLLSLLGLGMGSWGQLIVFLLLFYPAWCMGVKRRQDRDNNGLDYKILAVLSGVMTLLQIFGIGMTPTDFGNGVVMMQPTGFMLAIQLIVAIFGLYVIVQLGFLKGTAGPNSYGPDPLGYAAA